MNRFSQETHSSHLLRRVLGSAAVLCAGIAFLTGSASSISQTTTKSQAESLRQAILRSAVNCYASEGAYPESLDYLQVHYGINWNPKSYVVDYEIIGANMMPSVTVIPLQ